MKASMPSLVGNRSLRSRLCNDILNRTMAHAYVLAGPRGSGKHTIAMQYAALRCLPLLPKDLGEKISRRDHR